MKRGRLLLAILMIAVLLAGCGKKQEEKEPESSATPTAVATPTKEAEGTATPSPTEMPQIPEGTVFERFLAAAHNTFAEGNCTVECSVAATNVDGEEQTNNKKVRFNKLDDGQLVYADTTYSDSSKDIKYAFLKEDGGVYLRSWWGDGKMEYHLQQLGKNEAGHMYQVVHGFHEPGDEAFQAYVKLLEAIFPDWPLSKIPDNVPLLTLLAPISSEEYLQKNFGYHKTEDGADAFLISSEQIGKFGAYCASDFRGFVYYLGEESFSILSQIGNFELTVQYNGSVLDRITIATAKDSIVKIDIQITFSNIGTTTITLPTAMQEKFEAAKTDKSIGDPVDDQIDWLHQYEQDALDGRVDADVKTINDFLQAVWELLQDPDTNAAVLGAIGGKDELEVVFTESSKFASTGIPELDTKLQEKYGNETIKMQSVMWAPLDLHLYFTDYYSKGTVQLYYEINP